MNNQPYGSEAVGVSLIRKNKKGKLGVILQLLINVNTKT